MSSTDTIEPETTDTEASGTDVPEPAVLSEADLYLLGQPLAAALADGWREDTEESPAGFADKSIRLVHSDGRSIGIRHQWQGRAVQTFAVGGPAPQQSAGASDAPTENTRLPKGMRYSKSVIFTTVSPVAEILDTIRTVLLPAFDGPRPGLRSNGALIPPAVLPPVTHETGTCNSPAAKTKPKAASRRAASATRTSKHRATAAS
ncbi:hypothetical protein AB0E78_38495 [Streptomyces sp. NPDC032198]|uniref:hypothetical protein n=1 Tax=Streptomyces sp. NPDC032198 TaxID=3155127 RepID=UPI0033DB17FB